jgi:hypothetical protein
MGTIPLHLGHLSALAVEFAGTFSFVWHAAQTTIAGMRSIREFLVFLRRRKISNLATVYQFITGFGQTARKKAKKKMKVPWSIRSVGINGPRPM